MVADLLYDAQKENTTLKTDIQYHKKMTDQAQQNVTSMDTELGSNMQETFYAYKEINDALETSRAANVAEKERTSRLAGQISHLCREGAKVKADCEAHSIFSQTGKQHTSHALQLRPYCNDTVMTTHKQLNFERLNMRCCRKVANDRSS